jgi:hypothetical protein
MPTQLDEAPSGRAWTWLWLLALALGLFLRLDQLGTQIVADDEWHALIYLHHDYADIFSHFGLADHCIPLTLLDRLLYQTLGLSELGLRAVPLAAGIAALVALPWLLRSLVGPATAATFALLLALYPLHVYFSRSARPYSVSFLLALLALLGLGRWLQSGRLRHGVVYAASAALAPWFHLTVAPFVFAPVFCEAAWRVAVPKPREGPAPWLLAAVGALALAGAALLLAAPMQADAAAIALKTGRAEVASFAWRQVLGLLGGTGRPLGIAGWWLLAAAGLTLLGRRQPVLARISAIAAFAQIGTVVQGQPSISEEGIVFVRYILPVAGVAILGVAASLCASWPRVGARARVLAALALVLVWAATGPLPAIHARPNNWTNHGAYQFDYDRERGWFAKSLEPVEIPSFYRELADMEPGSVVIAEAPFYIEWHKSHYFAYQQVHRQETIAAVVNEVTPHDSPWFAAADAQARFRNTIPIQEFVRLRERGVRFLVLHLDLGSEFPGWDRNERATDMGLAVRFLAKRCGKPYERDAKLVVFELEKCLAPPPLPGAP